MNTLTYGNRLIRISVALLASIYIVLRARFSEVTIALVTPEFYYALTASFIITLLMIKIVHYSSLRLDILYGWKQPLEKRLIAQFVFGFISPLLINILCIFMYFGALGQNLFKSGFFHRDFPYVLCFVLLLNICYYLYYNLSNKEKINTSTEDTSVEVYHNASGYFRIGSNGSKLEVNPDEILYIIRTDRKIEIVTADRKLLSHNDSIANIGIRFTNAGFVAVARNLVINFKVVEGYQKGAKKNTLQINIKPGFKSFFKSISNDHLIVTKNYMEGFNTAFLKANSNI